MSHKLSPRELEALMWAARGKTYSETAQILAVSFGAVKTYLDSGKLKLDAVNVTHAVARCYELGILERGASEARGPMEQAAAPADWSKL